MINLVEDTYNPNWGCQEGELNAGKVLVGGSNNDRGVILHADPHAHDAKVH